MDSKSYAQIKTDVLKFLWGQSVNDRIQAMVLDLTNQALRSGSFSLSNQEKDRLTQDLMKDILLDILKTYPDIDHQK